MPKSPSKKSPTKKTPARKAKRSLKRKTSATTTTLDGNDTPLLSPEALPMTAVGTNQIGLLAETEDFLEDLKKLLSLPPEKIRSVAEVVNTDEGLDSREETIRRIVIEKQLDSDTLIRSLRIALFLRKKSAKKTIPIDDVMSELAAYCEAKQLSDYEPSLEAARSLIEMKEAFVEFRRRSQAKQDVLYSLREVDAVQDLRSVFDKDGEVQELIPMLLMRLTMEDDEEEEKRFSFQMTKPSLKRFQEAIGEYIERLEKLEGYVKGMEK